MKVKRLPITVMAVVGAVVLLNPPPEEGANRLILPLHR